MDEEYDETQLALALASLTPNERAAFAVACAERLRAASELFFGIADSRLRTYQGLLDSAWSDIGFDTAAQGQVEVRARAANDLAEDFDTEYSSPQAVAENAVNALAYAYQALLTDNREAAIWAARQVYDAADVIVQTHPPAHAYVTDYDNLMRDVARQIRATCQNARSLDAAELRSSATADGSVIARALREVV